MMRRFSIAILLLLALSACSVLAQPQPAPTPTQVALIAPPTVPATPTIEPTPTPAPDLPAIWIEADSNRLVAIDAQTGEVLNQTFYEAVYRERIASSDGHWQYLWQAKSQPENHWQVSILAIDLTRSTSPQRITVANSIPTTAQYPILVPHLALSKDNRLLFVSQSEVLSDQRHTRVYVIDVAARNVTQAIDVFTDDTKIVPRESLLIPSSDGRHLFVVQTMQRQPPATQGALTAWYTRVALLNPENGAVERVQVPNDMQAHAASVQAVLAPDGQRLFLLFIAGLSQWWFMGTAYAKIYAMPGAVLSPDGQRLYFIDILSFDREDGVWGVETAILKPIGHWFKDKEISGIMLSADGKELYAASPSDHTIYVLDALTGQTLRALNLRQSDVKPLRFVTGQ